MSIHVTIGACSLLDGSIKMFKRGHEVNIAADETHHHSPLRRHKQALLVLKRRSQECIDKPETLLRQFLSFARSE